jgi:hypothetical protein
LAYCLPTLQKLFASKECVKSQLNFLHCLVKIVGRCHPLRWEGHEPQSLDEFKWNEGVEATWNDVLGKSQSRFDKIGEVVEGGSALFGADLKFQIPLDEPIDATLFTVLVANHMPLEYPSNIKFNLKCRLFALGSTLIKLHNCLCQLEDGELSVFSGIVGVVRKSFRRVWCVACPVMNPYAKPNFILQIIRWIIKDWIANETSLGGEVCVERNVEGHESESDDDEQLMSIPEFEHAVGVACIGGDDEGGGGGGGR